jgi:hypothetical protein
MTRIDAHIHYLGDTPATFALLEELDLKMLNICVAEDADGAWRWQARGYAQLAQERPDRFAWCTSFDLPRFEDPQYVDSVIAGLEADFRDGAIACKAWKNFGMGVLKPSGEWMLVDDPLLEPIFSYVASAGKTLLMHIADPLDGWLPLRPGSPHYDYFSNHPEWHLHGRTDIPSSSSMPAMRWSPGIPTCAWWARTWAAWSMTWTRWRSALTCTRTSRWIYRRGCSTWPCRTRRRCARSS